MQTIVVGGSGILIVTQRRSLLAAAGRAGRAPLGLLIVALSLEALSLAAAAELQRRLLSGTGVRARLGTLLALVWASNAVGAALPVGAAASTVYSYRQLTRRGAPPMVAGWLLAASGALSGVALALLVVIGAQLRGLLSACTAEDIAELTALIGVVSACVGVLAWVSARPAHLAVLERRVHRARAGLARLRGRTPKTPTLLPPIELPGREWAAVTVLAVVNWAADGAVLAVSVAAIGGHLRWSTLVFAYALSQVAASMPLLPGSLGIAEGSLVVVLVCAGVRAPDALAATLVYRLASFWLQLLPGWAAWARLRHVRPFEDTRPGARTPGRAKVNIAPA